MNKLDSSGSEDKFENLNGVYFKSVKSVKSILKLMRNAGLITIFYSARSHLFIFFVPQMSMH